MIGNPLEAGDELPASVLLVDDAPANLLSLRAILEELGQNLVEARSGEEAIRLARAEEFAVILVDVLMPGLSGFEAARLIRASDRSRHTPIIFITASDIDRPQLEQGYALGAVDFLVKPLMPVVLRAKVRGFIELFQDKQRARREAEQLRLLVHGTADYAIFMLDPKGHVVTWNSGAERLKGYKAEEIIGQHFSRFYPQEAIDRGWPEHELKVAGAEGRFEDEGWRLRKDGTRFWANVVITALRDERGELRGFSKVTRDLTERKRAEEALRRSEERFRLLVEGVSDYAIFMLDPEGRVVTWNPGAQRLKGYQPEEIIGQHFSRFYPQEAIDRGWPEHELLVAAREGRFEDEGWRLRKDGTRFWANVVITALRDNAGRHLGFSKITRDMTERKRAEENARRLAEVAALAGQKRVLGLLVQGAPLADVLDATCEVIEGQGWDRLIATVLLLDEDGERLRSVAGRRAPADYARAVDGLRIGPCAGSCGTAAYRGEPVVVSDIAVDPLWAVIPDIRDLALGHGLRACSSTPFFSSQGKVLGTFAVYYPTPRCPSSEEMRLVDILTRTAGVGVERRRAEEALREADRRKDEFLATMAHELRNPLAPMRNALQIIQMAGSDAAAVAQAREMLERQMRHMVRLVDDLLDVSRITRGKLDLRKQRVDLAAVVHTAVETSRPLIEAAGHHLSITLPPQPVFVDGDPVRLAQVFANLLNNAAKYTERGGKIWLTVGRQRSDVVVSVRDTGLGIPREMLGKVFELFTQVDRTLEKAQGGLGIGLTLVRRLTEMHGGSVEARSGGCGHGSEFTVRMPAILIVPARDEGAEEETTSSSGRRILVVDDNRDSALSLGMLLQLMGNRVRTAHDGLEAVQAAENFRPDVVLLDLGLPKLNGYEVARHIRGQPWGGDIVLIAVTGWGQEEDRRRSMAAGFNLHMVKPLEPAALEKVLANLSLPGDAGLAPNQGAMSESA
jgi:PAS domain S-box-containing protein